MSNATLKADVERELQWEPSIPSERIGVSARNGVVELDGHVSNYFEKWSAERAALRVGGLDESPAKSKSTCLPNQFEQMRILREAP